jgi:hypothetical protein
MAAFGIFLAEVPGAIRPLALCARLARRVSVPAAGIAWILACSLQQCSRCGVGRARPAETGGSAATAAGLRLWPPAIPRARPPPSP